MGPYIDTHTHIYLSDFDEDNQPAGSMAGQASAARRAIDAGVGMMIFPNVDLSTVNPMKKLHFLFPENTRMAMGLHPTEIKESWHNDLSKILEEFSTESSFIAVGEVGVDLYWDKKFETEQMEAFDMQVSFAVEKDFPVIIHCREALPQVLEVLSGRPNVRAVFHSFGGTKEDVEAIRRIGDFYFGINGIVTFKNCSVKNVIPAIGADRLLTETDSPYLSPVPYRGKRNESSRIPLILSSMANALSIEEERLAKTVMDNANSLFRLS